MYKYYLFLLCWLSAVAASGQQTVRQYLSGKDKDHTVKWDFFCTKGRKSGQWTTIPVPSNWEFQGFGSYNYGHDKVKHDEQGLYKYKFKLADSYHVKKIFIVFEGSMTDTEVKINGKSAGPVHQGAFYRFKYDISNLVNFGTDNLLEVTVSKMSADASVNHAERQGDFWVFGGIFRPVYLEIVPQTYIDRIAVDAKANGWLSLDVFSSGLKPGQFIKAQVQTLKGGNVGTSFTRSSSADSIRLAQRLQHILTWNPEQPNLYNLIVSIQQGDKITHQVKQRFGFRTVELRKGDGIYVNDKKVIFKGICHHSEWPTSGRTLSKAIDLMDIKLIKDMNMNAVRMSHYPPDQSFLDVCDSLGLFVLDELTGWEARYNTEPGRKLLKEMVVRDVNHPSVVLWDNGNEGGWNRELDNDFSWYDPQKRTVIHPWERFNNTDTKHYPIYNYIVNSNLYGNDIYFPTEFMHGLYDGGLGAGLDDFWNLMMSNPHNAGGFLWVFADGGIVRTDKKDSLDTDGNHAPDGIVGPYREREGSYYTVKEIWSPVQFSEEALPQRFDGRLKIGNRYLYTDLQACSFRWQLVSFAAPGENTKPKINASGLIKNYCLAPGMDGFLKLNLPVNWRNSDALWLTVRNAAGRDILNRSWPIASPAAVAAKYSISRTSENISIDKEQLTVNCGKATYYFNKNTGCINGIIIGSEHLSLTNGPVQAGVKHQLKELRFYTAGKDRIVEPIYTDSTFRVRWTFTQGRAVRLDYSYLPKNEADYNGITFNYPEQQVTGMTWLGNGPYRVWKNRLKGGTLNIWHKAYNNTVTGESWVYPEFKGYHSNLYWVTIENKEHPFTIYTANEHTFLQMLHPQKPAGAGNDYTSPPFPKGDIGILNAVSAIGTKFKPAADMGPQSQKNMQLNYTPISATIWLDIK